VTDLVYSAQAILLLVGFGLVICGAIAARKHWVFLIAGAACILLAAALLPFP
jgi:hypothetical protein